MLEGAKVEGCKLLHSRIMTMDCAMDPAIPSGSPGNDGEARYAPSG